MGQRNLGDESFVVPDLGETLELYGALPPSRLS